MKNFSLYFFYWPRVAAGVMKMRILPFRYFDILGYDQMKNNVNNLFHDNCWRWIMYFISKFKKRPSNEIHINPQLTYNLNNF